MATIDQILTAPHANVVVDISHDDGAIDFTTLAAAGVKAVIHKATQGTAFVDPDAAVNAAAATNAGLLFALYHFGTGDDAAAQATHFLSTARTLRPDGVPLILDLEPNGANGMTIDQARAFVTAVKDAAGKWPGLYSGATAKDGLGDTVDPVLGACWLWLAQYDAAPVVQRSWARWTLWQYGDGTLGPEPVRIPGQPALDRSVFCEDVTQLGAFWERIAIAW